MKIINITPRKRNLNDKGKVELIEYNMNDGSSLKFPEIDDSQFFKVNINFGHHCMSRVFSLN